MTGHRAGVLVYDISDDAARARARFALERFADRFQCSGWLVPPHAGVSASDAVATMAAIVAPGDRVHAVSPCARCARDAVWIPERPWPTLRPGAGWLAT